MLDLSKNEESKGLWQTLIAKSGFVITEDGLSPRDLMGWMLGNKKSIKVNELASGMIQYALYEDFEGTIQDNEDLVVKGRRLWLT